MGLGSLLPPCGPKMALKLPVLVASMLNAEPPPRPLLAFKVIDIFLCHQEECHSVSLAEVRLHFLLFSGLVFFFNFLVLTDSVHRLCGYPLPSFCVCVCVCRY